MDVLGGADVNSRYNLRIVAKVAFSAVFGLIAYFLAQLIDADRPMTILMALFVAGVAYVTQFLIDLEHRAEEREVTQRRHFEQFSEDVASRVNRISEATELFGMVEASAVRTDEVMQLVRHATRVPPSSPEVVLGLVQAEIARVSSFLKEVAEGGDVTYEGEDRDWLLELTQSATRSIDATSLTAVDATNSGLVDGGLWMTDLGQRYLAAQQDAIRRGVTVRRVFILDRAELADDAGFQQLLRQHQAIGIEVRTVDPEVLALRHGSNVDYVLFDGVISYEVTPAARPASSWRPVIISTRLVTRRPRVEERVQRFADLWSAARSPQLEE